MKKILLALSLVTAFLFATGCDYDVNITVLAKAELINAGTGEIIPTQTLTFGPYTHYSLTDSELDMIFKNLIKGSSMQFTSASLYLDFLDNITNKPIRSEEYGVLPQGGGRYSYALMTY